MNWFIYAILGVALSGASPMFAKSGMRKSNANLAAAIRGTVLFLVIRFLFGTSVNWKFDRYLQPKAATYILITAVVTAGAWICLLRALQLADVIRVVPILEVSIVLELLMDFIFGTSTWNQIFFILLLSVGIFMMAKRDGGRGGRRAAGIGYALAAAVLGWIPSLLPRFGLQGDGTYATKLICYGIALLLLWIVVLVTGGYKGLRSMAFLDGIYLCLSGACAAVSAYCVNLAYACGQNADVQMVLQFELIFTVMLSCAFLREKTSLRSVVGMLLLTIGMILLLMPLPVFAIG